MIAFKKLGQMGRLGNQMFQIASTIGIAKTLKQDYAFPKWEYQSFFEKPLPSLDGPYALSSGILTIDSTPPTIERGYHFKSYAETVVENLVLEGYLQSPKYWEGHEDEVLSYLKLNEKTFRKVFENFVSLAQKFPPRLKLELVGIHVRRGDYAGNDLYHTNLANTKYYQLALMKLALLVKHYQLNAVVFSDDIEFCKQYFDQPPYSWEHLSSPGVHNVNFVYSDTQDPIVDMFTMSLMDHQIIANSSFSWWAAYLSGRRKKVPGHVISPGDMIPWFGPKYDQQEYNTEDLIPKEWHQI